MEPLLSTGPEPSSCLPASLTSIPGASVAWVTSTTIAASGSSEKAQVREPPKVVSSCAAATATSSHWAPPVARRLPAGHPPARPRATPLRAARLRHEPRCLQRHERAEAVVQRARGDAPVGQLHRVAVDHRHIPDPHQLARLLAVARADVDVQVAHLRHLLALLVSQQVDRLLADHPGDLARARAQHHALAHEDLRVPAAHLAEPQEALVVDVRHDQPDLVDVAHHHEPSRAASGHQGGRRTHNVGSHLSAERLGRRSPHRRGRGLVARRAPRAASRSRRTCAEVPRSRREQSSQDVLEDAAVAVVVGLAGRVDAHARLELDRLGPGSARPPPARPRAWRAP